MGGTVTAKPRPQPHELVRQLQFPPGYHFVPTEAELVDVYLRGKIEGREPPLNVVNEVAVLEWQPGSLVGKQTRPGRRSILSLLNNHLSEQACIYLVIISRRVYF